jgi:hypothetical protein
MMKLYYESATRGRIDFFESDNMEDIKFWAGKALENLARMRVNNMVRSVVCIRCYDSNDKVIFQYGSI